VVCWRVAATTPDGVRGYGVLLAPVGAVWRARIVTFPNVLWMVPGGGDTMKFMAKKQHVVLQEAIDFVRLHCVSRGHLLRDELQAVGSPGRSVSVGPRPDPSTPTAPRFHRRLPVHFGRSRPTILGHTGNLSETGLFVATPTPLTLGELLGLSLQLEHAKVPLRASVAWRRMDRGPGLDCGMGVSLVNPPTTYTRYIHALA